jgi:hypothetical protein
MAHRTAPPPRPTAPTLTLEQKRYRIERFQVCIKRLEDFDPEKVRRRVGVPEVVTFEAGIEKALSATFGYGTPSYFRFNLAARLDVGPLVTSTALESTVLRSVGGREVTTSGWLKKHKDIFPRAKRDRSPCSARRFAHLRRKSPIRARRFKRRNSPKQLRRQPNAMRSETGSAAASPSRRLGAVCSDCGGGAVDESPSPRRR